MFKQIVFELKSHAPFTILGAIMGIIIVAISQNLPYHIAYRVFYILHPAHVFLSALTTSAMYKLHTHLPKKHIKCNLWILFLIGYLGTIGPATLSDSIIPYLGEILLKMPKRQIHLGFIEEWWLINPSALLGITIAYLRPKTKFPHAGHVLVSTWASLFHIIMAIGKSLNFISYLTIFVFLFLAVWLPCCFSDIIFPLLFVKEEGQKYASQYK